MRPDGTGAQGARGSIGEWTGRRPAGAVTPAAAAVGIPGPPHQSTADAANHPAPTACGDRGGRTSRRSRRTGCTGSGRCARRAVRQRRNSWRRRRGEGLAPSPRASGVKMCGGERRRTIRPVGVHGKGHPDTNPAQGPHGEGCPRGTADHHLGDSRPGDGGIQKGASPLTAQARRPQLVTRPENRSRGAYAAPTPTECGGRATLTTRRNPRTGCRGTCWSAR
jgi:hypothetical protein